MTNPPTNNDTILRAVGGALHNWSLVELSLARLFGSLIGLAAHSQKIFGTIISFDTRVALCDRLASETIPDQLDREIWAKLSAKLSKSYKKRHEVAHFTLGMRGEKPVIRPFLTLDNIRDEKPGLDATQINERSRKFVALMQALDWFSEYVVLRRLGNQQARLTALQEPPLAAQLRELAALSLAERKSRAQPPRQKH